MTFVGSYSHTARQVFDKQVCNACNWSLPRAIGLPFLHLSIAARGDKAFSPTNANHQLAAVFTTPKPLTISDTCFSQVASVICKVTHKLTTTGLSNRCVSHFLAICHQLSAVDTATYSTTATQLVLNVTASFAAIHAKMAKTVSAHS